MRQQLTPQEIDRQALAFADLHERSGGDWEHDFERWAGPEGKDLWSRDAERVRAAARAELIARGILTAGPEDYLSEPAAA